VAKVKKVSSNILNGLAGEYSVCAELCRRGILALPTPKNNPYFDVAAIHPKSFKSISIQVKTMSPENKQGWKLGKVDYPEFANNDFFVVLVNLKIIGKTDYYIYDFETYFKRVSEIFDAYMIKPKRDGKPHKDPGFKWLDFNDMTRKDRARKNNWKLLQF
jgi:hypothetical protein